MVGKVQSVLAVAICMAHRINNPNVILTANVNISPMLFYEKFC